MCTLRLRRLSNNSLGKSKTRNNQYRNVTRNTLVTNCRGPFGGSRWILPRDWPFLCYQTVSIAGRNEPSNRNLFLQVGFVKHQSCSYVVVLVVVCTSNTSMPSFESALSQHSCSQATITANYIPKFVWMCLE